MKVAYVFHGLSGGMNQKGLSTIFDQDGFANIRDKLFDETCDYDTYYHTWEHDQQVEIQQLIKPKKCLYEDPNIFKNSVIGQLNKINSTLNENIHNFSSNVDALYSFYSRFYSMYKSVSLIENLDEYKLNKKDFYPFKISSAKLAMTAHILYSKIDSKNVCTFSKKVIKKVIRKKIGFKGILMSDDISMKALKYDLVTNAKKSLKAGCNLVLYCAGNIKDNFKLIKAVPFIDKFTIKKTSEIYKILR